MTENTQRTHELLEEIRDLLREQNQHMADIKKINAEAAARSMMMLDRSQEISSQTEAMVDRVSRSNSKYLIAFLVFMLVMLGLTTSYFRSLWHMFGL